MVVTNTPSHAVILTPSAHSLMALVGFTNAYLPPSHLDYVAQGQHPNERLYFDFVSQVPRFTCTSKCRSRLSLHSLVLTKLSLPVTIGRTVSILSL
jgi:hypothetical protein